MGILVIMTRTHRLLVLMAAAGAGWAAAGRAQLAPSSPFLPPDAKAGAGAAAASGPIELRGIMSTPEGPSFCIYDTAKKSSAWVGLNEKGHDVVVKSYDAGSDAISVVAQGRTMHVTLHTSKIAALPVGNMGGVIPGSQGGGAPNPITQTVVVNPTPADEAKRLEAVAAEVQRRRQMREQSMQGTSPGGAPAPGSPGAQPQIQPAGPRGPNQP